MKVICIDAKVRSYTTITNPLGFWLVEGNIYTVIGKFFGKSKSSIIMGWGYELAENPGDDLYEISRFIPLSEIDEIELVNQREIVNV